MQFNYHGASVLPIGNDTYFFAVENSDNSLSPFGGYKDKADGESTKKTAAREMWEESNGVFGDTKQIYKKLEGWENPANGIKRVNCPKAYHVCYITPFDVSNFNPVEAFEEKQKIQKNNEIKAIVAVPRNDLLKAVDTKNWNIQDRKIRDYARNVLLQARAENKL